VLGIFGGMKQGLTPYVLRVLRVALAAVALAFLSPLLAAPALAAPAPAALASAAPTPFAPAAAPALVQSAGEAADGEGGEETDGLTQAGEDIKAGFAAFMDDPAGTTKKWLLEDGPRIAGRIALFLILLVVSKILANFVGRVIRKGLDRSAKNASELFKNFVQNTATKVVFFIGLILALQNIGLDIAPLLAGIGVLGFVVGFALQDTLGNFAAGIMLLLYRPFDVGNYVEVAGREGTVESMTLVSTTLATLDNQQLTIPNGKIWGDVIRNVSAHPRRKIMETIGIGYDDDIDKATSVALEVVKGIDATLDDPEPQVVLVGLGDSSVNLSIRAWVESGDYFPTCCEIRRRVKMKFDEEGISIPFPQRDVHLHQVGGGA